MAESDPLATNPFNYLRQLSAFSWPWNPSRCPFGAHFSAALVGFASWVQMQWALSSGHR